MLRRSTSLFDRLLNREKKPQLDMLHSPEDQFATQDQINQRFLEAVQSPDVDRAISLWNVAKVGNDRQGLMNAAKSLVAATAAAYRTQGVPLFAHPPLPPQFVASEVKDVSQAPAAHRSAILSSIIEKFEPSARSLASQQFLGQMQHHDELPALYSTMRPSDWDERSVQTTAALAQSNDDIFDLGKPPKKINLGPRPPFQKKALPEPGEFLFYLPPPHPGYVLYVGNTPVYTWTSEQEIRLKGRDDDNDGQPDGLNIHQFPGQ